MTLSDSTPNADTGFQLQEQNIHDETILQKILAVTQDVQISSKTVPCGSITPINTKLYGFSVHFIATTFWNIICPTYTQCVKKSPQYSIHNEARSYVETKEEGTGIGNTF